MPEESLQDCASAPGSHTRVKPISAWKIRAGNNTDTRQAEVGQVMEQ